MIKEYIRDNKTICYIKYYFVFKTRCNRKVFRNDLAKCIFKEECEEVGRKLSLKIYDIEFNNNSVHFVVESNLMYSPNDVAQKIKSRTSKIIRNEIEEFKKMPSLWTRELFVSTDEEVDKGLINDFLNVNGR